MAPLKETSYGILAMLAMRPWSAYELSNEVRRYLTECMGPRAETSMYLEPKNLVAHGFARAKVETYGRRKRTVYSITPEGRRALRGWFRQSSAPPFLDSEAAVKMVFAEYGSRKALLATLTELERHAAEKKDVAVTEGRAYSERVGLPPQRLHALVLSARLYLGFYELVGTWARAAREEVEHWPDEWPEEATPEELAALQAALLRTEDAR